MVVDCSVIVVVGACTVVVVASDNIVDSVPAAVVTIRPVVLDDIFSVVMGSVSFTDVLFATSDVVIVSVSVVDVKAIASPVDVIGQDVVVSLLMLSEPGEVNATAVVVSTLPMVKSIVLGS